MRVLSLALVLSTLVATAACDQARADSDTSGQALTEAAPKVTSIARPAARQSSTASVPARTPQSHVVEKTNIKRDAAIGAGLGAVVGAVANDDDRLKGGLVGAVISGAAGAVVGKTIDKHKEVIYK